MTNKVNYNFLHHYNTRLRGQELFFPSGWPRAKLGTALWDRIVGPIWGTEWWGANFGTELRDRIAGRGDGTE